MAEKWKTETVMYNCELFLKLLLQISKPCSIISYVITYSLQIRFKKDDEFC